MRLEKRTDQRTNLIRETSAAVSFGGDQETAQTTVGTITVQLMGRRHRGTVYGLSDEKTGIGQPKTYPKLVTYKPIFNPRRLKIISTPYYPGTSCIQRTKNNEN